MPNFHHTFYPATLNTLGNRVPLTVREVEDAGLLEVLQTPGVAFGTWRIFDALLDPGNADFVFREHLGQAREVKTAISGLFGRFVARAYATRYLGYTHFEHIRSPTTRLHGVMRGEVRRVRGLKGDLPDWAAWGPAKGMSIIEAKGCHDASGPNAALNRAYIQAGRAEIAVHGKVAPFKRFAIATRWGFAAPKATLPMLSVMDPEEEGEDISPEEIGSLASGIIRRHCAALLGSLGHRELAGYLMKIVTTPFSNQQNAAIAAAMVVLDQTKFHSMKSQVFSVGDDLIGGFVTRNGMVLTDLSPNDHAVLAKLKMDPVYVGIGRHFLELAIKGEISEIQKKTQGRAQPQEIATPIPRDDSAGTWIIRLAEDQADFT